MDFKIFALEAVKAQQSGEKAFEEKITEALDYYSNKITNALCPLHKADTIFVIAALRNLEKYFSSKNQEAARYADVLCKEFGCATLETSVKADTSEYILKNIFESVKKENKNE